MYWIIIDGVFTLFFLLEFVLKFVAMRCKYFVSNWNRFDFFLVWVGIFGLTVGIITRGGSAAEFASKTRIVRLARPLRSLRFLRIFRLFHARMSADKYVSMDLARFMKKVTTLDCFIRAHLMAQVDLVKYFGGNGKLDESKEAEIARCVLQSQVCTYKALQMVAATQERMGAKLYTELQNLHKRRHITEGLSNWILKAHSGGALSATEAHVILHPLNHLIAETVKTLADRSEGMLHRKSQTGGSRSSLRSVPGMISSRLSFGGSHGSSQSDPSEVVVASASKTEVGSRNPSKSQVEAPDEANRSDIATGSEANPKAADAGPPDLGKAMAQASPSDSANVPNTDAAIRPCERRERPPHQLPPIERPSHDPPPAQPDTSNCPPPTIKSDALEVST
jgi:hypothetical protein